MITYTPNTALEAAVLESGRFELTTDTVGREVLCSGPARLPSVVLARGLDGLRGLVEAVGGQDGCAFSVTAADPWQIEPMPGVDPPATVVAAEEYLVMGLRPMKLDGRPLRVATGRGVVRLYLLPWTMPAKTLNFGRGPHFVVTSTRSVVGEWVDVPDGRRGVVVGLPEVWVGILERQAGSGSSVAFRCEVPVPWVGDDGLANATPVTVGAYEISGGQQGDAADGRRDEAWVAKLPIAMTEGNVVSPVLVPGDLDVDDVPDGPWETEWHGSTEFSMTSLN